MANRDRKAEEWAEAKRRCRLTEEEVQMAKLLGMGPRSLVKNIPAPSQRWKVPVRDWIRDLYRKKFGQKSPVVARSSADLENVGPPDQKMQEPANEDDSDPF
jgi:hypothetical protein